MSHLDTIRIRHPGLHNKHASVPNPFFVIGVAKGNNIKKVVGKITSLWDTTKSYEGVPYSFGPAKALQCGHPILWVLRFGANTAIPDGRYSLTVTAQDQDSKTIAGTTQTVDEFAVAKSSVKGSILYPAPNQDITFEIQSFWCYGTSDASIASGACGDQGASSLVYDIPSQTFIAGFPPITGTGELVLSVVDSGGNSTSEYVYVS